MRALASAVATLGMLGALAGSGPAQADLIPLDSRFGPDTIIQDTETGLDFLKVRVIEAEAVTLGQMLEELQPSGQFAEFRLAPPTTLNVGERCADHRRFERKEGAHAARAPCFKHTLHA